MANFPQSYYSSNLTLECFRANQTAITPGYVMGPINGSNPIDGNTDASGYPGLDQIGRTSPTVFLGTHSTQPLDPLYQWGNVFVHNHVTNYASKCDVVGSRIISQIVQPNRDYYDNVQAPGYTPYVYPHPLTLVNNNPMPGPTGLRFKYGGKIVTTAGGEN